MLIGSSNCSCAASSAEPRALRGAAHARRRCRTRIAPAPCVRRSGYASQLRQLRRIQLARLARARSSGASVVDHADIVAGLERRRGDQRAAADLVQRVFQLRQPVCGVDVHQDQPGLGGGELGHHPFGIVRRPDADALARLQSERDQSGGERIDLLAQLAIAPADALLAGDQRRPVAPARNGSVEITRRSSRRSGRRVLVPCA